MHLVNPEIARQGIQGAIESEEQPYYAIFVCLLSYDCIAISPRNRFTHGYLFSLIMESFENSTPPDVSDEDIVLGIIEFEEPDDFFVRTCLGTSPEPNLNHQIVELVWSMVAS